MTDENGSRPHSPSSGAQSVPSPGELLRRYGRPAKKSFGQNFLTDPAIIDRLVHALGAPRQSPVLEIGPGPGALTSRLLAAGHRVVAVEADADAAAFVERELGPFGLKVVLGDALGDPMLAAMDSAPWAAVGNLPYHVATPILFRLVDEFPALETLVLMFQDEVASRIVNKGADREFGTLALATQIRFAVRRVMRISPGAFLPAPKVHSAVVAFERRAQPLTDRKSETAARALGRAAFNQRRKMLRASLDAVLDAPLDLLEAAGIAGDLRPEQLTVQQFVHLGETFVARGVSFKAGSRAPDSGNSSQD